MQRNATTTTGHPMIAPYLFLTLALAFAPIGRSSALDPDHRCKSWQGPEAVAQFQMGSKAYRISRDEVSLFLVRRTRNSRTTKEAVEHLIDVELVREAAIEAGLMPSTEDVDAELSRLELQVKRSKQDFDKLLATSRMNRKSMSAQLALSIAKRRLTAKALRRSPEQVTSKHLDLWSKQRRNKVAIVTDAKLLPSGVTARVGSGEITNLDLGRVLFIKITPDNLRRTVQEIVFMRLIGWQAAEQGISLTKKQFEQQFRKTKAKFERKARSQGVNYEAWLAAMGGSKQEQLDSPTMRSILQHEQLVRRRYSTTLLDDMLAKNGAEIHRRHGARRNLSIIFVRATKNPNKIVKHTFVQAAGHAKLLRETITKGTKTFAMVARTSSDDADSKIAGGKIGWQHREYQPQAQHQRAPAEVLEAAFGLSIGKVSEPIKTGQGYYLVWLSGIEPTPERATLHRRMLGELSDSYGQELIASAKIQMLIR